MTTQDNQKADFTLFELQATEHFYSFTKNVFQADVSYKDGETYYEAKEFNVEEIYSKRRRLYEPYDKYFLVRPYVRLSPTLESVTVRFFVNGKYEGADDAIKLILLQSARDKVVDAIDEYDVLMEKKGLFSEETTKNVSSIKKDRERLYQVLFRLNKESNEEKKEK